MILLDGDLRRRSNIARQLSRQGLHVECYERVSDLKAHVPRDGLVLVHDRDDAIPNLADCVLSSGHWVPIVAFGEQAMPNRIVDAIRNGAVDYILWPFDYSDMPRTLMRAQSRAQALGRAKLGEVRGRRLLERLTKRERQVLSGIAADYSNHLIAENLAISVRSVGIHRKKLQQKLGVHGNAQLIRLAIEALVANDTL